MPRWAGLRLTHEPGVEPHRHTRWVAQADGGRRALWLCHGSAAHRLEVGSQRAVASGGLATSLDGVAVRRPAIFWLRLVFRSIIVNTQWHVGELNKGRAVGGWELLASLRGSVHRELLVRYD
jgi:hypothetical protein